jgi:hypothetical protein
MPADSSRGPAAERRQRRLAEALRENLKRRKAQQRRRAATGGRAEPLAEDGREGE